MRKSFGNLSIISQNKLIEKTLNDALANILGVPGSSAGKAQEKLNQQIKAGAEAGAYTSAQMDSPARNGAGLSQFATSLAGNLGLAGLQFGLNEASAAIAYNRQNEFYDNHLSMQAKVREYEAAGLNPMSLGGAGVGATSAPSVQPAQATDMSGILSTILNYKLQKQEIDADTALKREELISKRVENRYLEYEKQTALATARKNFELLTSNADIAHFTALWCPQMLKQDYDNKVAREALDRANTSLSEEKVSQVKQEVAQAREKFPKEMDALDKNIAQTAALAYMYRTAGQLNESENTNAVQKLKNLEEENRYLVEKTGLAKSEAETFMARNTEVKPIEYNGMDYLQVKSPDGKVTLVDAYKLKRDITIDLKTKKVTNK